MPQYRTITPKFNPISLEEYLYLPQQLQSEIDTYNKEYNENLDKLAALGAMTDDTIPDYLDGLKSKLNSAADMISGRSGDLVALRQQTNDARQLYRELAPKLTAAYTTSQNLHKIRQEQLLKDSSTKFAKMPTMKELLENPNLELFMLSGDQVYKDMVKMGQSAAQDIQQPLSVGPSNVSGYLIESSLSGYTLEQQQQFRNLVRTVLYNQDPEKVKAANRQLKNNPIYAQPYESFVKYLTDHSYDRLEGNGQRYIADRALSGLLNGMTGSRKESLVQDLESKYNHSAGGGGSRKGNSSEAVSSLKPRTSYDLVRRENFETYKKLGVLVEDSYGQLSLNREKLAEWFNTDHDKIEEIKERMEDIERKTYKLLGGERIPPGTNLAVKSWLKRDEEYTKLSGIVNVDKLVKELSKDFNFSLSVLTDKNGKVIIDDTGINSALNNKFGDELAVTTDWVFNVRSEDNADTKAVIGAMITDPHHIQGEVNRNGKWVPNNIDYKNIKTIQAIAVTPTEVYVEVGQNDGNNARFPLPKDLAEDIAEYNRLVRQDQQNVHRAWEKGSNGTLTEEDIKNYLGNEVDEEYVSMMLKNPELLIDMLSQRIHRNLNAMGQAIAYNLRSDKVGEQTW